MEEHNHHATNGEVYDDIGLDPNDGVNYTNGTSNEPKGPPQACLFVASLSPETTEDSLRDFFLQAGTEPLKIKVLKDRSARPYAFVQFKSLEDSNLALQNTNNKTLDGRRVRVEKAKVNRTLFIAKMDKNLSSAQLREVVEAYGPIENVTIIKNHQTNKSKGCGFVKFVYREDAMNAFMGLKNNQRKWVVEWATSNNDPDLLGIDRTNLFIGGLNPAVITKELVEQRFGAYGQLETVSLVNKEGENPVDPDDQELRSAFAFIRYADGASSAVAIEHENGAEWLERRIRVQYCESQEMKNKRRAAKYFNTVAQYNNQYFRGVPNPMGPMMMMGGVPMYNMPTMQRNTYRKGDAQNCGLFQSIHWLPHGQPRDGGLWQPVMDVHTAAAAATTAARATLPHPTGQRTTATPH